jgi:pimeloyl-ACP methyl ester carboxylesterase
MNAEVNSWKEKGNYFTFKGNKIFYIMEGKGDNLLLLHGYPYSSFDWSPVWNGLVKAHTLIAPDFLGMGFSDKPQLHSYSYHEHSEIINQLLQHLRVTDIHILSHDLGVSVAQELILRNENKQNLFGINSIAFLNGGLFMDVYRPRLIQRLLSQSPKPVGKLLNKLITKKMISKSVKEVFGPYTKPDNDFLDNQWEILNYNDGKSITYLIGRLVFEKYKYQTEWITAMKNTLIPMCFINGPHDPNSGMHMADRYKELIPDPEVILLDKSIGHWPQWEDPNGVLSAYSDFRKGTKHK